MSTLLVRSHITLNLSRPNSGVVVYAKQFDKDSRIIDINLVNGAEVWDPPAGTEMVVMYAKPDGTKGVYDQLEDNTTPAIVKLGEGHIQLTLAEQALTAAGNVFVEISFYTSALRSTTLSFILAVESGVPKNEDLMSDDYFNILSELIQGLLGATTHPPQINPINKNWMLWDENAAQYVDSGYSSIGIQGIQGDQGWSIVRVVKTSGTGAAGTIDTYGVYNNDPDVSQQYIGAFDVYNGQDGEGARGSAVPLPDDGSGAIGDAYGYSREDHQHPLNVSNDDPEDIGVSSPGTANAYARSDHSHGYGNIFDLVYPVGSIYMSVLNTDPSILFGGEWTPLDEGRVLIGANSSYPAESTGGSVNHLHTTGDHILTVNEMPSHTHRGRIAYNETGYSNTIIPWSVYLEGSGAGPWGASGNNSVRGTNGTTTLTNRNSRNLLDTLAAGGGGAHNHGNTGSASNMPPYLAVYMWQRTA